MEAKRATIYLDPALHKALKMKAAESSVSVSELVNDAVRQSFSEDLEDITLARKRAGEPVVTYEDMLKRLKKDGLIQPSGPRC